MVLNYSTAWIIFQGRFASYFVSGGGNRLGNNLLNLDLGRLTRNLLKCDIIQFQILLFT